MKSIAILLVSLVVPIFIGGCRTGTEPTYPYPERIYNESFALYNLITGKTSLIVHIQIQNGNDKDADEVYEAFHDFYKKKYKNRYSKIGYILRNTRNYTITEFYWHTWPPSDKYWPKEVSFVFNCNFGCTKEEAEEYFNDLDVFKNGKIVIRD